LPELKKLRCQVSRKLHVTIADKSTPCLQRKIARAEQTTGRNYHGWLIALETKNTYGGGMLKQENIPALTLPRSFIFERINKWGLTPQAGASTCRLKYGTK